MFEHRFAFSFRLVMARLRRIPCKCSALDVLVQTIQPNHTSYIFGLTAWRRWGIIKAESLRCSGPSLT